MARRPHEHESTELALDLSDTPNAPGASPRSERARARRGARSSRRPVFTSLAIVGTSLALLLAGGAMLSAANGADTGASDPLANTVRAIDGAPTLAKDALHLNENLVGIAATPDGGGYWLTASDGGVFAFGDASFAGSLAGESLAAPVVGITPTPTGHGYWLVAADGGVFAFGDAPYVGGIGIPDPLLPAIAGMAPTPTGHGYYLLAADGGVFAFGDARFAGSAIDGHHLATAIAVPHSGVGYVVARTDGSVVGLAGAPSVAATADALSDRHPVIGIGLRDQGAWLVTSYVAAPDPASTAPSQDPFLVCTRAHESDTAGGYRAVSPDGLYHGAYQFLQSTWNNVARAAGRPDLVGVDPAAAAPADQDQLALFLFHQQGTAPWGGRCAGMP